MNKIHLVDKCLILFMIVLLAQSTFSLFTPSSATSGANQVDIIIRTAIASIFGYFLSSNFIRQSGSTDKKQSQTTGQLKPMGGNISPPESIQNQIGFNTSNSNEQLVLGEANGSVDESNETSTTSQLQIIVATAMGIFCLIVLLLMRNALQWRPSSVDTNSVTATVVQFRDIVSSCVGFLIGCPTNRRTDSSK